MRLTAILITKNEERHLKKCLESLWFCDEKIVVDSGSADGTLAVAQKAGAKIFSNPFSGFAAQKQIALEKAQGEWVLNVDADERVSPELAEEILSAISLKSARDGHEIPFQFVFLGRWLRFGDVGGERHLRLFRRERAHFSDSIVHEEAEVAGKIGRLRNFILHESYDDLSEYFKKLDQFSTLAAQKKWRGERPKTLWLLWPFGYFLSRYILKFGFLDGLPGLIWAGLSSLALVVRWAKGYEMSQNAG